MAHLLGLSTFALPGMVGKYDCGFNHRALWVSNKDKSSSNQPAEPDETRMSKMMREAAPARFSEHIEG